MLSCAAVVLPCSAWPRLVQSPPLASRATHLTLDTQALLLKISLLLLLGASTAHAACELQPTKVVGKRLIGELDAAAITARTIGFSPALGDITDRKGPFNFDTLYEMDSGHTSARFRFNEAYYVNGSSVVGNVQWEGGQAPDAAGPYRFYALQTEPVKGDKTLVMLGDSITWWSYGRYFRCLLAPELPDVQFVGPHTDALGYGHAGEGGNTTKNILSRLGKIQRADHYFILAGTNDWGFATPARTAENLKLIAKKLSQKGGKVMVSTLLPRLDKHDARNREVNRQLRAWNGQGCNCQVVDLDKAFRRLPDQRQYFWDAGLHPNLEGYQKIAEILGPGLRRLSN